MSERGVTARTLSTIVRSACQDCDWDESVDKSDPRVRPTSTTHAMEEGHTVIEVTISTSKITGTL